MVKQLVDITVCFVNIEGVYHFMTMTFIEENRPFWKKKLPCRTHKKFSARSQANERLVNVLLYVKCSGETLFLVCCSKIPKPFTCLCIKYLKFTYLFIICSSCMCLLLNLSIFLLFFNMLLY